MAAESIPGPVERSSTNEVDPFDLSNRVAALERLVRLFRNTTVVLVVSQASWFLMGAAQQPAPETRQFTLVDKNGKQRIRMETDDKGNPSLTFFDADGKAKVEMAAGEVGTYLSLSSETKSSATLQTQSDGGVNLVLDDGRGPNIRMSVDGADLAQPTCEILLEHITDLEDITKTLETRLTAGETQAYLAFSKGERTPLTLGVDEDGKADLTLGGGEPERAVLKADAAGATSLILRDKAGGVVFQKP